MKNPKTLIREREGANPPVSNRIRFYTYVRPLKNEEATVEVWGAMNHRTRKGHPLVMKKFLTFRTDRMTFKMRDMLWYSSWSVMAHDHLMVDFKEAGLQDIFARAYHLVGGEFMSLRGKDITLQRGTDDDKFIVSGEMLNGWEGTKYRYCAYDSRCNMDVMEYLDLYREFPMAEMMSKTGNYQLLHRGFLTHLRDNKEFARYVGKHRVSITEHAMTFHQILDGFFKGANIDAYEKFMRDAERARANAVRERITQKVSRNDARIFALYERIKDICGRYGAYDVVCPMDSKEMLAEGDSMHNCIGKCYSQYQGTKYACLFLRKDGKPCVDIRIDLKTFKVIECRAVCNKNAPKNAWTVATEVAARIQERMAA